MLKGQGRSKPGKYCDVHCQVKVKVFPLTDDANLSARLALFGLELENALEEVAKSLRWELTDQLNEALEKRLRLSVILSIWQNLKVEEL